MATDLTIIIVNWNGENFLPDCLRSVADNPPHVRFEVVVVDNASSDGSVEWLRSAEAKAIFPQGTFKVIESQENLGFGRANNLLIDQTDSPYVLLLNPDTILKPNAIDRLVEALQSDDRIGAVAPKLLNPDGSLQPSVSYFPPTPLKIVFENFRLYRLLPANLRAEMLLFSHWKHDRQRTVPIVWGAAILFDGKVLRTLKGFDPEFRMYGEDMDICIRLSELGYKLEFVPASEIVHLGGASSVQTWTEQEINEKKFWMGVMFEKKHTGRVLFYSNCMTRLLLECIRLIAYTCIGRDLRRRKGAVKLNFRSLWDRQGSSHGGV